MSNLYSLHIAVEKTSKKEQFYRQTFRIVEANDTNNKYLNLAHQLGFKTLPLIDEDASCVKMMNHLGEFSSKLKPNDLFLITFIGHGFKRDDSSESDNKSEFFGLRNYCLEDKYFTNFLRCLAKGVLVIVIFDSCYSGGLIDNNKCNYRDVDYWLRDKSLTENAKKIIKLNPKENNIDCSVHFFSATDEGGNTGDTDKAPAYSNSVISLIENISSNDTYCSFSQKLLIERNSSNYKYLGNVIPNFIYSKPFNSIAI